MLRRPTNYERKLLRQLKREAKARQYRAAALAGGGKREVARRRRQYNIATDKRMNALLDQHGIAA